VPGELARLSPPSVSNPSDNLKNLFELPVLFYALSLYLFVTRQVDGTYVAAAWVFFVFRVAHSAIHRAVPRARRSLPRASSMTSSAPNSGRNVTTERIGQFISGSPSQT
jgi:hypothetical protein